MQYLPEKDCDLPRLDLLTLLFESQLSLTTESTILHAEAADSTNHITKAQARTITKRLAHVFRSEFGIGADGPGKDAVMCISANQVLLPAVFCGIIGAGGVYTAASTALTTPEVSKQLRQSRSKVIVACPENRAKARDAARDCGIPLDRVLILESMGHRRLLCKSDNSITNYLQTTAELEWERIVDIDALENTTICLLYSSGTTGPPKGVMLSHMNLVSEALFTQLVLRESKKGKQHLDVPYRTVGHLPTAHIAGCLGSFITPAVAGGTVYWMPKFNIDEFIDYCKKYAVTFLSTAPPVYHAIVRSNRVTDQFKTLVRAESGAAPLSLELQEQAERKLGCTISQRWGMTESTGSVTTMPWGQSDNTGDISPLLPNMRLRLVDERMKDVRSGDEGEILLKGPMITKGYFDNPEATAEAFTPDGWYKTGDIGVYKNGKIIMVDRKKELIKYKGLQVSPVEVEGFLLTHASVADVAVVGAPDPEAPGNELPRAYVVIKAGSRVSEAELKEYVKSNLASHKQLRGGVLDPQLSKSTLYTTEFFTPIHKMHTTLLSNSMRSAALCTRVPSATLNPIAFQTSIYQTISLKNQTRPSSTSTVRFLKASPTLRTPSARPQSQFATSCINAKNTVSVRSNSTTSTSGREEAAKLDWNSYFKLRASRRRYTLASSIVSSAVSTMVGVQVLSSQNLESLGAQVMGLDPFVVLGMATAACGAVGWLVGPFLGNAVWGLVNRSYKKAFLVKEKEFFDRIKRYRVDPSSNSMTNPVPDYYGEKISSVQGYRQWLKDQRAYNRKRRSFIK
ncbi:hypothetical protein BDW67DRAFT_180288 [Aspergillus spinulosporus]